MKRCKVPCNTGAWHACIKVQICGSSGGSCHYQKRAGVGFMSFCSLFRLPLYLEKLNFLCRNGKKYCTDLFPAMTMRSKMMTFCVEVWTIENNWLQNMRWWQVQFWRSLWNLYPFSEARLLKPFSLEEELIQRSTSITKDENFEDGK